MCFPKKKAVFHQHLEYRFFAVRLFGAPFMAAHIIDNRTHQS